MSPSGQSTELPLRLVVDGHSFVVSSDRGQPGAYHYDWVSGSNAGYGFSPRSGAAEVSAGPAELRPDSSSVPTLDEHVAAIRGFLTAVDPVTGFVEDA